MLPHEESLLLTSTLTLSVQWSARVTDFAKEWQNRQALAYATPPSEFWHEAASVALSGVELGPQRVLGVLADLYHGSHQLPAPGDFVLLDALELQVDQRHFVTRRVGGVLQVEIRYQVGIESYRYASAALTIPSAN
jgi:hypothetical protein